MKRLQLNSLITRILVMTFTGLLLVLGGLGLIIDNAYQDSLKAGIERELSGHAYNLMRIMEESGNSLKLPAYLQEQRLNRNQSGLQAYLVEQKSGLVWRSLSSKPQSLAVPTLAGEDIDDFTNVLSKMPSGDKRFERVVFDHLSKVPPRHIGSAHSSESSHLSQLSRQAMFSYQYAFEWEFSRTKVKRFLVVVHLSATEFEEQVQQMRYQLLVASAVLILVVMLLQVLVVIMGLSPLKRISKQLGEIEQGKQESITGEHPVELRRFVTNLNLLLESLRRQSEGYQNRMADLAHALKTPLTVINNQLNHCEKTFEPELNKQIQAIYEVKEPLETIDQIVRYQLQRTLAPDSYQWHQRVEVSELMAKILRSLQKVYQQKGLSVAFDDSQKVYFYGESGDFYELAGNLIDNAFKAANTCVKIELTALTNGMINDATSTGSDLSIRLVVEDDGQGIAPNKRQAILNRGIRLDTLKAGQGIGLSVVNDLVSRYRGTLKIEDSPLGGAKFIVTC